MSRSAQAFICETVILLGIALLAGCGGFGSTNTTNPGSTPNIPQQTSFRIVGDLGTPFVATVSDGRSSWVVFGAIPTSIVIVNDTPPDRILVTKLSNDTRLLSLEIVTGFSVELLSSTVDNYGSAVGAVNTGKIGLTSFAPPASPDVRFYVNGPAIEIFDALIEDQTQANVVQTRAPAVLLFDSPNGGGSGRVDGIFTAVSFFGPFDINMTVNGTIVDSLIGGTSGSVKFP
jgi:hypothetical protein